jgi:hypothetical protein
MMNQQAINESPFLKPLQILASSSERFDDDANNSTIFREMDCEHQGPSKPPTVTRANPVFERSEDLRVISPLPYMPIELHLEDQDKLTEIDWNWEMDGEESVDMYPIENLAAHSQGQSTSLYSFYFETVSMEEDESDDFSITSHESDFTDEELETISVQDPVAFWEEGIAPFTQERSQSPSQISLGSNSEIYSNRLYQEKSSSLPTFEVGASIG